MHYKELYSTEFNFLQSSIQRRYKLAYKCNTSRKFNCRKVKFFVVHNPPYASSIDFQFLQPGVAGIHHKPAASIKMSDYSYISGEIAFGSKTCVCRFAFVSTQKKCVYVGNSFLSWRKIEDKWLSKFTNYKTAHVRYKEICYKSTRYLIPTPLQF